jgi:hypothetical protein
VSRGRRYSHHSRRKNEKDGGFNTKNKSVLFSSKERRETREREREREKEKREESAPSNYTLSHHTESAFSCNHQHHQYKKKRKEKKTQEEELLLLLLTWLGQFTTRKDNARGKPVVILFW